MRPKLWFFLALLAAVVVAHAQADTVVLRNGMRLKGQVSTTPTHVTIRYEGGVLELPGWQVTRIEPARRVPVSRRAPTRRPGAARVAFLDERLDVDFEDTPLKEALEFLTQNTSARMELGADVGEDEPPVSLSMQDATLRAVLERILTSRELKAWVSTQGRVRIERKSAIGQPKSGSLLEERISVDFDNTPLRDVLTYLREQTGMGLALHADVNTDADPVTLHLTDASVRRILGLVLRPRGYRYTFDSDNCLCVRKRLAAGDYTTRVYPVMDLLLSREDVTGGTSERGGMSTGRTRSGSGVSSGFFAPQYGGRRTGNGDDDDDDDDEGFSDVSARAQNLVLLLKQACGHGTWISPASTGLIDVGAD